MRGSPPTEKLVAFFSGPVRLDAEGKATINFDIPAVQWHGPGHGRRLDQGCGRPCRDRRDRARPDRDHRRPAALPGARRSSAGAARHRQHRWPGGRLPARSREQRRTGNGARRAAGDGGARRRPEAGAEHPGDCPLGRHRHVDGQAVAALGPAAGARADRVPVRVPSAAGHRRAG